MADKDLMMTAGLDMKDAIAGLTVFEKRVEKMVKNSDQRIRRMGTAFESVAKKWRDDMNKIGEEMAGFGTGTGGIDIARVPDSTLQSYKNLTKTIREMEGPLNAMIANLQRVAEIPAINLKTGEVGDMPRFEVRDQIAGEMANLRKDVLQTRLEEIMEIGKGIVAAAAANMRNDLINAFGDSTASGKQLLDTVILLEGRMKGLSAAALSAELIPTGTGAEVTRAQGKDITAGIYSEEKGKEVLSQIETFLETADGKVKAGVDIIANNLRNLLDRGAGEIGGEAFEKELNDILTTFNKLSGLKPLDLVKEQEIAETDKLYVAYKRAISIYEKVMATGDQTAQHYARNMKDRIDKEYLAGLAGEQSAKQASTGVKNYIGVLKELTQFKTEDPVEKMILDIDLNAMRDHMFKLMDGGNEVVKKAASDYKDELAEMLTSDLPPAIINDRLKEIKANIDAVTDRARADQPIGADGIGTASGRREDVAGARATDELKQQQQDLVRQAEQLMTSAESIVREGSGRIRGELEGIFEIPGIEEQRAALKDLENSLKNLEGIKPLEYLRTEDAAAVQEYNAELRKLEKAVEEVKEVSVEGAESVTNEYVNLASASRQRVKDNQTLAKEETSVIKKQTGLLKDHVKTVKAAQKEEEKVAAAIKEQEKATDSLGQAQKKVDVAESYRRLNDILKQSSVLMRSNKNEARDVGATLRNSAEQAREAFKRGDISAEELNEELKRMEGLAKNAGRSFEENVGGGADRASVSIWKVGNALDRTGVRGAGGIIRIVDAFKGLGPAAIGAAVAIGGVLIVVTKLLESVVELGKKAAEAFTQFIKGAVGTAKSIEVTDRLLGSLIKAPELGSGFRDFLLSESFRVGLDLTEDFARAVVPLANTTEQITEAATQAGILAHAFQQTEESVARAFKQATGGHFRPFQQLFGITPQEIDKIQDYQEQWGNLQGVILGLQDALETRGLSLSSLEDSLQLIQGRLNVVRTQLELTVGTPVRDALGEQLTELFKIVEDRGPALRAFFTKVGDVVADVIGRAGDFVKALIGDVDDQDLVDLGDAFDQLGIKVSNAVEAITDLLTTDDRNVVETIEFLIDKLTSLTEKLVKVIDFFEALQNAKGPELDDPYFDTPEFQEKDFAQKFFEANIASAASLTGGSEQRKAFNDAMQMLWDTMWAGMSGEDMGRLSPAEIEIVVKGLDQLTDMSSELEHLEELSNRPMEFFDVDIRDEVRDLKEANSELSALDAFNEARAASDSVEDLTEEWEKYLEAIEKVTDAQKKMELSFTQAIEKMEFEADIEDLEQRIKEAEAFEDLYRDHNHDLEEMVFDRLNDEDAAIRAHNRKNMSSFTKYNDKLLDIERKSAKKRIDIEQKYREKLEDIRRRFDLDAEEAIRRNDAVALLRIRRRMRAEMEEAQIERDRAQGAEDDRIDTAEEDARISYERQLRDNQTFLDQKNEDIDIADAQKRDEMMRQLNWERKTLEIEHKRQREAMKTERETAFEELKLDYRHRQEQMDLQFEEEYKIVEKWKTKETKVMEDALRLQTQVLDHTYSMWLSRLGSIGGIFQNFFSMVPDFMGNILAGDPFNPNFGSMWADNSVPGQPTTGGISGRFIAPYIDPYGPPGDQRQHGGYVTPGNVYGVNERGVEAFMATRAGIVLPRQPMPLSLPSKAGATNIDNSRHMDANVDLLDPNQMTPMMRAVARSVLTDEILNIGF